MSISKDKKTLERDCIGFCKHKDAIDKDWLPSENGTIKLHPHCEFCGLVKNITSDKAKRIGYFENAIGKLKEDLKKRNYNVTQVQTRLIIQELEENNINEIYSNSFSNQKKMFSEVVSKYIKVNKDFVLKYV